MSNIGARYIEHAKELNIKEAFLASHIANAVGLELAEAFAEYIHQDIRLQWGFADDSNWGVEDLFKLKYRTRRYSPDIRHVQT